MANEHLIMLIVGIMKHNDHMRFVSAGVVSVVETDVVAIGRRAEGDYVIVAINVKALSPIHSLIVRQMLAKSIESHVSGVGSILIKTI